MSGLSTARLIWLGLFASSLFISNAYAEVTINKSYGYFHISGNTPDELDAALERNGPSTITPGPNHPGATEINFGGELSYIEENGRCKVGDINVKLDTRILLPKWKNQKSANPELQIIWETLLTDIKRHEERHAELAREYARKLDKRLGSLRAQKSCDVLETKVSEVTDQTMAEHDRDQQRFDRVESHNFDARMDRLLNQRLNPIR